MDKIIQNPRRSSRQKKTLLRELYREQFEELDRCNAQLCPASSQDLVEFDSVSFDFYEQSKKAQAEIQKRSNKIIYLLSSLIEENRSIKSQSKNLEAVVQASLDKSQELVVELPAIKSVIKEMKEEVFAIKSDLSYFEKPVIQKERMASSNLSFNHILKRDRNEIKESGCSSSPSNIAPALKSSENSQLKSLACLEFKVDSNDDCSKSQDSTPASQLQCEDVAIILVTPPQSQKQICDQSANDSQLLVDNKRLSLAISGQYLQSVDESKAKEFFMNQFNRFIGPFNSGLARNSFSSDIIHIQKNLDDSSFYLRFKNADLRDAVFFNKFCLSSDAVGDSKLYSHSFLSAKEKRNQAKLLKDFYTLSSKTNGRYSFRGFPNGDSLKIISRKGNKEFLFALDSKAFPAEFLRMKGINFKQQ